MVQELSYAPLVVSGTWPSKRYQQGRVSKMKAQPRVFRGECVAGRLPCASEVIVEERLARASAVVGHRLAACPLHEHLAKAIERGFGERVLVIPGGFDEPRAKRGKYLA